MTSVLALFIALGGTSYAAITLPRNSVGMGQIRAGAVGKSEAATNSIGRSELRRSSVGRSEIAAGGVGPSEVRGNAVDSDELRDGGIKAVDLADAAKTELAALDDVTFRAFSNADATTTGGATTITKPTGTDGTYTVDLGSDVSTCQFAATVIGSGADAGFATVTPDATNKNLVTVSTFAPDTGALANKAFNLLAAC